MQRSALILITGTLFLIAVHIPIAAQSPALSIEEAISNLLNKYQLNSTQDINCDSLNDDDFELLGEAWMESQHPGEAHNQMDNMMSSDNSESLRSAHINMGLAYLGCPSSNQHKNITNQVGGLSMLGSGIMGHGMMSGLNEGLVMNGLLSLFWLIGFSIYILIIILLLVLIRYFWKKGGENNNELR